LPKFSEIFYYIKKQYKEVCHNFIYNHII
jgi:hypothetical protein